MIWEKCLSVSPSQRFSHQKLGHHHHHHRRSITFVWVFTTYTHTHTPPDRFLSLPVPTCKHKPCATFTTRRHTFNAIKSMNSKQYTPAFLGKGKDDSRITQAFGKGGAARGRTRCGKETYVYKYLHLVYTQRHARTR